MIYFFWFLTFFLILLGIGFVYPWLRWSKVTGIIFILISGIAYSIYFNLGSAEQLKEYYLSEQVNNRAQRKRMQPLLTELKKQEYKLRFYLEESPNDVLAHSQLFEILGIQALQLGNVDLAKQCFVEALNKISEKLKDPGSAQVEYKKREKHLKELIMQLEL